MGPSFRNVTSYAVVAVTRRSVTLVTAVLLLAACSNTGPELTPNATVSHASTTLSVPQGSAASVVFTIERRDGHDRTVHFVVEGAPTGILAAFSPSSVSGVNTVTTLSVSVAVLMPAGTYTFQARVTGEGVVTKTVPVTLTVLQPGISLTIGQHSATVEQQRSMSVPLTLVRRDGYAGAAALSVIGLPEGVTADFEPKTLVAGQTASTLTLTASLGAELSTTALTVRAVGTGTVETTAPLQITVSPTTTPGVLLIPSPAVVQVRPGEVVEARIETRRFAGFQGALTFSVTPFSDDIFVTIVPIAGDAGAVVVRVQADPEAAVGTTVLTVRATGNGIAAAESQVTVQVVPHPTFTFSTNNLVTLVQGTTVQNGMALLVNRIAGFAEPIRLSVDAMPAGLTTTPNITNFEISGSEGRADFTYVASVDAAPGPHTLTVRGLSTVTGKSATTQVPIIIRARGSYALGTSTPSISMPAGTQRILEISITRTGGFSGNIAFSMVTTQLGMTAQFTPNPTTGNAVQMLVSIGVGMTPRTFTVIVRGTSPGADNVELPLTITVTP